MAQHKYFISKRQLSHDEKQSDLINNEIQQLNKKASLAKMEQKQYTKLNNNILSNLKLKIQYNKIDQSQNSKLSQNSKKSQKSVQCQIRQNTNQNSQNSTKSKPTQYSNISNFQKVLDKNKQNLKQKLNPQIIQLLLSKQTPTNLQTKNSNKVKSDTQKRNITPNNRIIKQKSQKSENLKPILPIKNNQNSFKDLIQFQDQDDLNFIECDDEAIQSLYISNDSIKQEEEQQQPYLKNMLIKDKKYEISQSYVQNFSKNQKQMSNQIRGILLDWMQQVCMEYMWKRETFHLAQYYLDAYLNLSHNVKRQDLQLVGVTCLQIATKQEELSPPSVTILRQATANIYQIYEINIMEINILNFLKYNLNPQTKNVWCNYYIIQWDSFMHENLDFLQKNPIYFRQPNQKSYLLFRELFQLIDLSILDLKSLIYQPRLLIASMMYLVIGRNLQEFNLNQILKQNLNFEITSYNFNYYFQNFLFKHINCTLKDIIPLVIYSVKLFEHEIEYEFPRGAQISKDQIIESHFEDFLAFQTYTQANQNFIQKL